MIDETVDLAQPIVDAVGLALPFVALCAEDCPGLCSHCGVALATAEAGHSHEIIDPRWAKLADLRSLDPDGTDPDGTPS